MAFSADRMSCFESAAHRDPRWCDRVGPDPESSARRSCISSFKPPEGNAEACAQLHDPTAADACYLASVRNRPGDEALCEKIGDAVTRDECWGRVSLQRPDMCFRIRFPPARRHCAQSVFATAKDSAICSLVPVAESGQCRIRVSRNAAK
jgi:hypothetical protein